MMNSIMRNMKNQRMITRTIDQRNVLLVRKEKISSKVNVMYAPEQTTHVIRSSSLFRTIGAVTLLFAGWCTLSVAAQSEAGDTQEEQGTEDDAAEEATTEENPLEYVHMRTSLGDIVLELNREKAPLTVANFLAYTESDYYNGTIFHRVISTFMIQGGGFTSDMEQKKTNDPVKNEFDNGLSNMNGTIAMARTSDPDSATSQFFINVNDNVPLDKADARFGGAGYCVFGKVIAGMDTVEKIRDVRTGINKGFRDVPVEPVVIEDVAKITKERVEELKSEMEKDSDGGA